MKSHIAGILAMVALTVCAGLSQAVAGKAASDKLAVEVLHAEFDTQSLEFFE